MSSRTSPNPPHPPLVSVVCHAFNHEAFIASALESMLNQVTTFPFEIIVHDDASTDRTPEIIAEYAAAHPEIVRPILQETNQYSRGFRPPRFTFPAARGEFIAFCEGDDYWSDTDKLQAQVDAMHRHPGIDLCVHPATRLSMHNGKLTKGFDHGTSEKIIEVTHVIARHDQFAPTASMLMRTERAQSLPDWFFHDPGLPVGDFFIEALLGRKGTLYLPQTMSVYRRGVPGSHTQRFRHSAGQDLEQSMDRMLRFTEKLRGMENIPDHALDQRLSYIRLNYALQLLAMGDRQRFNRVSRDIRLPRHAIPQLALEVMQRNGVAFQVGRAAFGAVRRLRG